MNHVDVVMTNEHLKSFADISKKKKKKNIILFIGHDTFAENSKYLYLHLVKKSNIDCVWCTENKKIVDQLHSENLPVHSMEEDDIATINLLLEARIAIFSVTPYVALKRNHYYFASLAGAMQIQLWHGISVKKLMLQLTPHLSLSNVHHALATSWACRADYILSTTPQLDRYWTEVFGCQDIIHAGYPRNEVLVRQAGVHEMIGSSLEDELDVIISDGNKRKIILMPTWQRDKPSPILSTEFLTKILQFSVKNNIEVFLKVHKHYFEFGSNQVDFSKLKVKDFHCIDNGIDIYPHLNKFDLLITDYSSVMFDFLLTGKPVIAFDFEQQTHQRYEPDYSLLPVVDDFIYKVTSNNVEYYLHKALTADDKQQNRMTAVRGIFNGDALRSCEDIIIKIMEIMVG